MSITLTQCLACNEKNCFIPFKEEDGILQCTKCDAIQTDKDSERRGTYEENYEHHKISDFIKRLKEIGASKIIATSYMNYLRIKTPFIFKTALDVGAKYGVFVKMLLDSGIDAHGIESFKNYINLAVTDRIELGYFNTEYKNSRKYDLICLTQMMYYVRDNYSILSHAKSLLNKDGIIFIATINPASSVLKMMPELVNPVGSQMIFSKKNYTSLKDTLGLEMIDYTTYRSNFILDIFFPHKKMLKAIEYYLKLKESFTPDKDGNFAYLLLKPFN